MILINTKTNQSWYNCSKVFVTTKICIDASTIRNWEKSGRAMEQFNHWQLYFNPTKVTQKKGFAIKKQIPKSVYAI